MHTFDRWTKAMAWIGVILIWFPLLTPLVLTLGLLIAEGIFRLDYLMPAELFLFALAGGALLFWAAWRVKHYQQWIGWGMFTTLGTLILSQSLAVVTGLANGDAEPVGWRLWLVMGVYAIFLLALIFSAVGGIRLTRIILLSKQPE